MGRRDEVVCRVVERDIRAQRLLNGICTEVLARYRIAGMQSVVVPSRWCQRGFCDEAGLQSKP